MITSPINETTRVAGSEKDQQEQINEGHPMRSEMEMNQKQISRLGKQSK